MIAGRPRRALATAVLVAAGCVGFGTGAAAAPAPQERGCAPAGDAIPGVPWAQQLLVPERVRPFSRGDGVTVAVLSSGVDAGHPQLAGRVAPGFDAVVGTGTGPGPGPGNSNSTGKANTDCRGLGTQAAGLVAASPVPGVGFAGLAPAATVLPVRVVPQAGAAAEVDPAVLARGITWATAHGATVIAVTVAVHADTRALRTAVATAVAQGVTVVAAVGEPRADGGDPTPYPAAYNGVIGVGALDPAGGRWPGSAPGPFVDLVAPGANLVTLQRAGGLVDGVSGTGFAAAQVAGTVALVRARHGALPPAEMARRLTSTAVPTAPGAELGHGVVNPYAAVTETVVAASPVPLPAFEPVGPGRPASWARTRLVAFVAAAVAIVVLLVAPLLAAALSRGRRRSWRPGLAAAPPHRPEPVEPGPPVLLFEEQASPGR